MYAMFQNKTQSKHNNSKIIQRCPKRRGRTSFQLHEDRLLRQLVETYGPKNWQQISSHFNGTRTARECRERWNLYLAPIKQNPPWTAEEETRLMNLVQEIGTRYAVLAKFFSNRSEANIKNKYSQLRRTFIRQPKLSATKPNGMIDFPIPDLLEMDRSAYSTTCALVIPDFESFRFTSGGNLHAEEKAVEFAEKLPQIADGILPENASLFFQPSKSPCTSQGPHPTRTDGKPGCLEQINALDGMTIGGTTFHCSIGATKPYYSHMAGGKQASIDAYNNSSVPHAGFVRT